MPIQIDLGGPSSSTKSENSLDLKNEAVVGIDLGTTHSLVAWSDPNSPEGQVKIVKDSQNQSLFPSAVLLNSQTGQLEALGWEALKIVEANPSRSKDLIVSIKRLMGRGLKDVGGDSKFLSFPLTEDSAGNQVLLRAGQTQWNPIEISASILKALKTQAEKQIGKPVRRAVVTVPAYFDDAQRSATKAAGRLAGLEVLRVFNEPTAAALAYGWSHEKPGKILVFDLGGGTFDVSILRIEKNIYEVLATQGDVKLGGDDFDSILMEWVGSQISQESKHQWEKVPTGIHKTFAEKLKRDLSESQEATYQGPVGTGLKLDRKQAEKLWKPLLDRALRCCSEALASAQLDPIQIDDVLLVGGSTRMPCVRSLVEEFFKKSPNISLNPDEAVALGAGLQARALATQAADKLLLDVIPLSLGIETFGGAVSKLILRNSTLPTEAREVFTNHAENQTGFDFHILQGERELVADCRSLARFKLKGLEPAPPGFHRIEVIFRIDTNGILNVRARDLRSQKSHEIEVRPSFGLSENELLTMLESAHRYALADMEARQLVDVRVEAETVIRAAEKTLINVGAQVGARERADFEARLIDLKNALSSSSPDKIRKALEELDEVGRDLAELQVNRALSLSLSGKEIANLTQIKDK